MSNHHHPGDVADAPHRPHPERVLRAVARRSFATIATTSPAGWPHVAGVLYQLADGALYVSTLRSSRKARNLEADPRVAVVVPIRRAPVGPPATVQFQSRGELLAPDHPDVRAHVDAGRLRLITSHGELDLPDGCFLRIPLPATLVTYGLGMSLLTLVRDPLNGGGRVSVPGAARR